MTEIMAYVCDRSGDWLSPLPTAEFSDITWGYNGEDTAASFSVNPFDKGASAVTLYDREIQIWIDGDLEWWGVPWTKEGRNPITYTCEGLDSLLNKRIVDRASLLYTSIDQLSIGAALIDYAQNESVQAHRDLNINVATIAPSGVPRSRDYPRELHATILDLLKEFPTLNNGFDWDIVFDGSGQRLWTPYYPKKGSIKSNLVLQLGRNIEDYNLRETAVDLMTDGYIMGATEGEVQFEAHYENTTASAAHGVAQGVISEGSEKDVSWLLDRITDEVELRKVIARVPDVTAVHGAPVALRGQLVPGDWAVLRIDEGANQVNDLYRVKTVSWKPGDLLSFSFSEAAA